MPFVPPIRLALAVLCAATWLSAQCQPFPFPTGQRAGGNGATLTFGRWDPDGAGPQPELLLVAGSFTEIGNVRTSIATYDPATGVQPFADCNGPVHCFATDSNGDLLVGGAFTAIGSVATGSLARFDGSAWSGLGAALTTQGLGSPAILSIAVRANGDLAVGGSFDTIAGVSAWSIAERQSGVWQSIGDAEVFFQPGTVTRVLEDGNGDLLAAGAFASIGGVATSGIARWDGTSWAPLGSGTGFIFVYDALLAPNGDVYVIGPFASIGGTAASWIARWDGSSWNALPGLPSPARCATLLPGGGLAVGGQFPFVAGEMSPAATWDGTAWTRVGVAELPAPPLAITTFAGGELLLGGPFQWVEAAGAPERTGTGGLLQSFQGAWQPLITGTDGVVHDVASGGNNEHFVAGSFQAFSARPTGGLSRVFTQTGVFSISDPATPREYRRLVRRGDGTLFLTARFQSSDRIYRHQSGSTQQIGTATSAPYDAALAIDATGALLVGAAEVASSFPAPTPLARLDAASGAWWPVDPLLTGRVRSLCVLANGDLVVGGDSLASGATPLGNIARWDGSSWDPLQGGLDGTPVDLEPLRDGGFAAVGTFQLAGGVPAAGIATWDGQSWQALGGGFPQGEARSVVELPTGDLLVGGDFQSAGGVPASYVARWNGAWNDAGVGLDGPVRRMDVSKNGEVAICGDFLNVPNWPSAGFTALLPSCPTLTDQQSFACGGALPLQIDVRSEAWRNATIDLEAAPFLQPSIAVGVFGLQSSVVPLSTLGLPGSCFLEVQPDVLLLALPQQGSAPFALDVPNLPTAVGVTIYHQTLDFEFSSLGSLSIRTSPRIGLQVGSLW